MDPGLCRTRWAFPTAELTRSVTQQRASFLKVEHRSLLCSSNCVMVMRRPRFRSTGTWLEIRSAVQFTVWPKKSKAWLLNWSQVLNWSQAQPNLFVFSVSGAGDGNRTHVRSLGSFYTAIVRRPLVVSDCTQESIFRTAISIFDAPPLWTKLW